MDTDHPHTIRSETAQREPTFQFDGLYFASAWTNGPIERHKEAHSHSIKVKIDLDIHLHGNRNSILAAWFKSPVTKRLDRLLIQTHAQ